jgi:V8-like Glu-specific endopeptidase
MYEITDRSLRPYSAICYIQCTWADGTVTRATGVIVGVNDVLTAHHVVYDAQRGGYATSITISPGADTSPFVAPYGSFSDVGVVYARTADWDPNGDGMLFQSESQYDLALLGMRGTGISTQAGIASISNSAGDFQGTADGYPALQFGGTGLMEERVTAFNFGQYSVFDIFASLGAGASGGPLLRTDSTGTYVMGVLSGGAPDGGGSTYAALFGAGNWEWLLQALDANNSVIAGAQMPANQPIGGPVSGTISYLGTSASDTLAGTNADEGFRGLGGSDLIDGSGGLDTALYMGIRSGYSVRKAGGGVQVADASGRDGNDTLLAIEHLLFTDMSVNLQVGAQSQLLDAGTLRTLEELYIAFFRRVPDADGLSFWIGQAAAGASIVRIGDLFYEAGLQYPSLTGYTGAMTHEDFVNAIYRNVLGRTQGADADGLQFWSMALAQGTHSHGSLVAAMLDSAHTFKGDAAWGWVADLLDNKAQVAHLFAVEMGLGYNGAADSISHGMEIAAAVTATSVDQAIALIGVTDGFSTLA